MSDSPPEPYGDEWFRWITDRRFGGSDERRGRMRAQLMAVSRIVLDRAEIHAGDTLLDVGTGDGLIAFAALQEVGQAGTVIFSDISSDLLDACRRRALDLGAGERCRFVEAAADRLEEIRDESADVVTTRSVLIYVEDKAAAFGEFHRVLRPGGRLSIYEPIDVAARRGTRHLRYDLGPVTGLGRRVQEFIDAAEGPAAAPMRGFDERDLLSLAEGAGFAEVRLDLLVHLGQTTEALGWDAFLESAPNPLAPAPGEAIRATLSASEAAAFEAHLRPLVEQGHGERRSAVAYLAARRSP